MFIFFILSQVYLIADCFWCHKTTRLGIAPFRISMTSVINPFPQATQTSLRSGKYSSKYIIPLYDIRQVGSKHNKSKQLPRDLIQTQLNNI